MTTQIKRIGDISYIFVYDSTGVEVGRCSFSPGEIRTLEIDPLQRRKGYGTLAVKAAIQAMNTSMVTVLAYPPSVQPFYRQCGFQSVDQYSWRMWVERCLYGRSNYMFLKK